MATLHPILRRDFTQDITSAQEDITKTETAMLTSYVGTTAIGIAVLTLCQVFAAAALPLIAAPVACISLAFITVQISDLKTRDIQLKKDKFESEEFQKFYVEAQEEFKEGVDIAQELGRREISADQWDDVSTDTFYRFIAQERFCESRIESLTAQKAKLEGELQDIRAFSMDYPMIPTGDDGEAIELAEANRDDYVNQMDKQLNKAEEHTLTIESLTTQICRYKVQQAFLRAVASRPYSKDIINDFGEIRILPPQNSSKEEQYLNEGYTFFVKTDQTKFSRDTLMTGMSVNEIAQNVFGMVPHRA